MLIAALLALAAIDEPPPPAELIQAGEAWSACLDEGVAAADSNASAGARADAVLARCRPLEETMTAAHRRWIDSSALSDREKEDARRAMTRSMGGVRAQLVSALREGDR